ncbi:MAG: FtsQ-type POTRA domain-containing protein [Devosiaceae bacterium]|nr:FtsQ-type POTRA domain-containing protein [Devosiaceae bacterium MH13]
MPPVIVDELLALPLALRARAAVRPMRKAIGAGLARCETVRFPNAALASLVVAPTIVFGFSFGERMEEPRAALSADVAKLTVAAGFGVQTVTIEGLRDTRQGDVLDYLAVGPQTSMVGFDLLAARERVLALPWVRDASVRKVYPDTVFVEITEHDAFARMLENGRIHLVTVEGEEITREIGEPYRGLPLVVGEGAPQVAAPMFAALASHPYILENVVALERVGERRWTLHMRDAVQVHLPEGDVVAALSQLDGMMRQHAILDRAVASIDLRRPEQLVVRLTEQGLEALEADLGQGGAG